MAPLFARCCVVAAGMWLASAGPNASNLTRRRMAAGQNTSNITGRRMGAGQNTSNTTDQPMAAALTSAEEAEWKALMKSNGEMAARVNLMKSNLHLASESHQSAIAELATAREEREKRVKVLEEAKADLKKVKDEFVESIRGSLHGISGGAAESMGLADDAVVYAEARVRHAVRAAAHAKEQTAVAVQHSMEAEALAKAMELDLKSGASVVKQGGRGPMNTSLSAQKLHELAVQARLVPEENATEKGVMPELNETIGRMELTLREEYDRMTNAQHRANALAAEEKRLQKANVLDAMAAKKERRMQKRANALANHSSALKGRQDSKVVQSNKTAGALQPTTKTPQIQHAAEVMNVAKNKSEAVHHHFGSLSFEVMNVAKNKSEVVQSNKTAGALQQTPKKLQPTKHQIKRVAAVMNAAKNTSEAVPGRRKLAITKANNIRQQPGANNAKQQGAGMEGAVLRAGQRRAAGK